MCGACGILSGTPDWVEGGDSVRPSNRLAERYRRIALVNRFLAPTSVHLRVFGNRLVVQSATGRTRIVTDLAHVWRTADEIGRSLVDPLDVRGE